MGVTVGSHKPHGWSGVSTVDQDVLVTEFVRQMSNYGHVTTEDIAARPWEHHVAGCGIGHDDSAFAETGRSQAAYVENDADWRWWSHIFRTATEYFGLLEGDAEQTAA